MIKRIKLLIALFLFFQIAGYSQLSIKKIKVSDDIELIKISDNAYIHVSYIEMQPFGRSSANGLLLIDKKKAFLLDTPWDDTQTKILVNFISDSLHAKVSGFVPNHWHNDCIGGLKYLNKQGIKSYANQRTINIAQEKGLPVPKKGFKDSLTLKLNNIEIQCYYFGKGHSTDNIVVWIPSEKILFPGCMVKDMQSNGLGNLSDANVNDWPKTILLVIDKFPLAEIVIPGHGQIGGKELLTHTMKLLKEHLAPSISPN